ncbi:hypothetical protein HY383_01150 [Candidatus Daviesbacteria bacterium]|nr:hypothetical protein [Candidatus Daviesbacteria bacterium]
MAVENSVLRPIVDLAAAVGILDGSDIVDRLDAFERMDPISAAILARVLNPADIVRSDRAAIAAGNVD